MTRPFRRSVAVFAAAACLVTVGLAQAAPARSDGAAAATVRVTLKEFSVALSAKSAPKGAVTFVVTNKGKLPHDFKIAGRKTALLARGKSARLSVKFAKAGRYAYLCTVAGHRSAGMKGVFTVR